MYSANRPLERQVQVAPASSLRHTPPHETAITRWLELRGSIQSECKAASSLLPPNHLARFGRFHRPSTSCHSPSPLLSLRNRAAGSEPAQIRPGWSAPPASSAQIWLRLGAFLSSDFGRVGMVSSSQVAPWLVERCSLAPK